MTNESRGPKFLDIYIVMGLAACSVISVFALDNGNVVRMALAIALLFLCPGYMFAAALWPEAYRASKEDQPQGGSGIDSFERIAISIGGSIGISGATGLFLNYSPFALTTESATLSVFTTTVALDCVATVRRARLPEEERFGLDTKALGKLWPDDSRHKAVTVGMVIAIATALLTSAYLLSTPSDGEKFTEFYIKDSYGGTDQFPSEISVNQAAVVIVGVICHEGRVINYTIVASIGAAASIVTVANWNSTVSLRNNTAVGRSVVLAPEGSFQDGFRFKVIAPGTWKVVWRLYIDGQSTDYEVHKWVKVEG